MIFYGNMIRDTPLHRALAKKRWCSRKKGLELIRAGKVKVNGVPVIDPSCLVSLDDEIELNDPSFKLSLQKKFQAIYAVMNKPRDYVTTASDDLNRQTVYDLLPPDLRQQWVFPVGRLDKDSEGLLLFTNDSDFSTKLTDPAFHVPKVYRVQLDHLPAREKIDELCGGVVLAGEPKTLPCTIVREQGRWFLVTLREGRNRQIRRMFWHIHCRVKRLIRVNIGGLECPDLKPGETRMLKPEEFLLLWKTIG